MKKTILGLFAFVCAFSGVSCSEDDLSGTSVIKPEQTTETPLDAWLYKNYIEPYNIEFRYRYEDMESDMIYDLTPANYEKSVQMAKLVKHLCLQAYDEVTGSRDFITSYFPKMVFLVGSPAYNNNGEVVLGTAAERVVFQDDPPRIRSYPQPEEALLDGFQSDHRFGHGHPLCRQRLLGCLSFGGLGA